MELFTLHGGFSLVRCEQALCESCEISRSERIPHAGSCCCNIMVFSPFKVQVTYYHPLNLWLLGATSGNQGQTVMCLQCSETIKICLKLQIPYYHPLNLWLLGATNGNQGQSDAPLMF